MCIMFFDSLPCRETLAFLPFHGQGLISSKIVFDKNIDIKGTSFKDYLNHPYSFTEAVKRLKIIVGLKNNSSFEITGTFEDQVFTLYDRKDQMVHIGGSVNLNVPSLQLVLIEMMKNPIEISNRTTLMNKFF